MMNSKESINKYNGNTFSHWPNYPLIRKFVDKVTPEILKKFKYKTASGNKKNTPELDLIAWVELKKEYLKIKLNGNDEDARVLKEFIDKKPKFAIFYDFGIFFDSTSGFEFDELIFANSERKEGYYNFLNIGQ